MTAVADGSFFEKPGTDRCLRFGRSSTRSEDASTSSVSSPTVASTPVGSTSRRSIELAAQEGVPDLVVHAFTDGRDTLPHSSLGYLEELERWLRQAGRVGTVSGRYFGMDRDGRWERTKLAYDAIAYGTRGSGSRPRLMPSEPHTPMGETDEFVRPSVIGRLRRNGRRRTRPSLQLPPGSCPPARSGPGRGWVLLSSHANRPLDRVNDAHRAPRGLALPGRLSRRRRLPSPSPSRLRAAGASPASRCRDREIRACHLLLQRRPRAGVGGGGAPLGRITARRRNLRPAARDERCERRRCVHRRVDRSPDPLRDSQLRQSRHGRSHRRRCLPRWPRSRRWTACLGR